MNLLIPFAILAIVACGTTRNTGDQTHSGPKPINPVVVSLPPLDQDWCYRWHAVEPGTDEQAFRQKALLGQAYALDRNLAMRVSNVFMYSDVRAKVMDAVTVLLRKNPGDVDALVARGLWSLILEPRLGIATDDLCSAATHVKNRGDFQEYCADALNAQNRREEGSQRLVAAYSLYDDRTSQCRVVRKIEATAPHLDEALKHVSPLVMDYCKREQQAIANGIQSDEQRRQAIQQCKSTCQAGAIICRGWQCAQNQNACIAACN